MAYKRRVGSEFYVKSELRGRIERPSRVSKHVSCPLDEQSPVKMVPREGFEPSTSGFRSRRSDVELTRHSEATYVGLMPLMFSVVIVFVILPITITQLAKMSTGK